MGRPPCQPRSRRGDPGPAGLRRSLLDRTAVRHSSVEIGVEPAHGAGQAHHQKLRRRAEHREGMQGSWRDGDRRPWSEVEALHLDFDDHPAVQYVVGLAPAGPVQRRCRPPRRVDLEKLVVTVGVSRVDLDGEDRVWGSERHRARRDIAALAAAGLGVSELHAAAIRVIGDQVSAELTCWAAIDPETLLISTMVSRETRIPPEYEPRLAEAEY